MRCFSRPNRRNKTDRTQYTQKQSEVVGSRFMGQKSCVIARQK